MYVYVCILLTTVSAIKVNDLVRSLSIKDIKEEVY